MPMALRLAQLECPRLPSLAARPRPGARPEKTIRPGNQAEFVAGTRGRSQQQQHVGDRLRMNWSMSAFSRDAWVSPNTLESVVSEEAAPRVWEGHMDGSRQPKVVAGVDQTQLCFHRDLAEDDSLFASFRGVDLHYTKARPFDIASHELEAYDLGGGLGLGTPAVMLHGFGSSEASWRKIVRPLALLLSAPVVAFDRPGFGLTQRLQPSEESLQEDSDSHASHNPYSSSFSVDATLRFAQSLEAPWRSQKVVLIGHSAGCEVGLLTALKYPDTVAALVLVAPAIIAPILNLSPATPWSRRYFEQHSQVAAEYLDPIRDPAMNMARGQQNVLESLKHSVLGARALLLLVLTRSASATLWCLQKVLAAETGFAAAVQSWIERAGASTAHLPIGRLLLSPLILLGSALWAAVLYVELQGLLVATTLVSAARSSLSQLWKTMSLTIKSAFILVLRSEFMLRLVRTSIDRFGKSAVRLAWHDPRLCDEEIMEAYTKPLKCYNWDRGLIEFMVASLSNPRLSASKLKEIKCPVLVVVGNHDKIFPPWNAKWLADDLPHSVLKVMPDCGHVPQEENPALLISIIQEFMKTEVDAYIRSSK